MSVWSTKSQERDKDYVVIKHTLPGVNNIINGIKFRSGYAVVEKDSKTYYGLKKLPVLKGCKELPLNILRKLPFIIRTSDIKLVYGVDVYLKFIADENKSKEVQKIDTIIESDASHVFDNEKCKFLRINQEFCKEEMLIESPSGYCWKHLLQDPKLTELGIEVSKFVPKADKNNLRESVSKKLLTLKKEGKF